MKLKTTALLGAAALALMAGSASAGDLACLITKNNTNPFFVKMKEGAEAKAKELGLEFQAFAGKVDGDAGPQIEAIENCVASGAKGILITASNDSVIPALKDARSKGVLVIALDTPIGDADAAAHGYPVHEGHDGLLIGHDQVVEAVLVEEELPARDALVGQRGVAQEGNIAASTETAPFGMVDDHSANRRIIAPRQQRSRHAIDHRPVERVDRLGPVERKHAHTPFGADQNIVGHCLASPKSRYWRSRSRPMIIFITSLVPSRMRCTRRSRQKRSIG